MLFPCEDAAAEAARGFDGLARAETLPPEQADVGARRGSSQADLAVPITALLFSAACHRCSFL